LCLADTEHFSCFIGPVVRQGSRYCENERNNLSYHPSDNDDVLNEDWTKNRMVRSHRLLSRKTNSRYGLFNIRIILNDVQKARKTIVCVGPFERNFPEVYRTHLTFSTTGRKNTHPFSPAFSRHFPVGANGTPCWAECQQF
jgi:hypothetical protein